MHSEAFEARELLKVVSHRENVVSIYLAACAVAFVLSRFVTDSQILLVMQGLLWTGIGTSFLLLALALKEKNAWWAFVAAFIPLVNLFMVFRLRGKATEVLKNHGITITKPFKMRNQIRRLAE